MLYNKIKELNLMKVFIERVSLKNLENLLYIEIIQKKYLILPED